MTCSSGVTAFDTPLCDVAWLGMQAEVNAPINPADHQGLVWMVVKRYLKVIQDTDCLESADLMQAGNLGMMRAIESYDAAKGKWSTFAVCWIRHHVRREIQDKLRTVRIPVHRQDSTKKTRRLPKRNTRLYVKSPEGLSWDAEVCVIDLMQDRFEPDVSAEETVLKEEARSGINMHALTALTDRERVVIRGRFWEDKTLAQVGELMGGISRERVRQIEAEALAKLRRCVANDG
jgi:RNA polymerase sigma factor (sigma-70 family)